MKKLSGLFEPKTHYTRDAAIGAGTGVGTGLGLGYGLEKITAPPTVQQMQFGPEAAKYVKERLAQTRPENQLRETLRQTKHWASPIESKNLIMRLLQQLSRVGPASWRPGATLGLGLGALGGIAGASHARWSELSRQILPERGKNLFKSSGTNNVMNKSSSLFEPKTNYRRDAAIGAGTGGGLGAWLGSTLGGALHPSSLYRTDGSTDALREFLFHEFKTPRNAARFGGAIGGVGLGAAGLIAGLLSARATREPSLMERGKNLFKSSSLFEPKTNYRRDAAIGAGTGGGLGALLGGAGAVAGRNMHRSDIFNGTEKIVNSIPGMLGKHMGVGAEELAEKMYSAGMGMAAADKSGPEKLLYNILKSPKTTARVGGAIGGAGLGLAGLLAGLLHARANREPSLMERGKNLFKSSNVMNAQSQLFVVGELIKSSGAKPKKWKSMASTKGTYKSPQLPGKPQPLPFTPPMNSQPIPPVAEPSPGIPLPVEETPVGSPLQNIANLDRTRLTQDSALYGNTGAPVVDKEPPTRYQLANNNPLLKAPALAASPAPAAPLAPAALGGAGLGTSRLANILGSFSSGANSNRNTVPAMNINNLTRDTNLFSNPANLGLASK